MAIDLNIALANALLDRYDTEFPAGSLLQIRTGAPAGADNAAGGSLLVEVVAPASPWAAASLGSKAKANVWSATATGSGVAGHYRLKNAADTRREEGTVGLGTGDMAVSNTDIAAGQPVVVASFSKSL